MNWVKLLFVWSVVAMLGCYKKNEEAREVEMISQAFCDYYSAVEQRDYGRYERVAAAPMSEERFLARSVQGERRGQNENPVCQIMLGIGNVDAHVIGLSPWTARESEFRVRKIGNKFKIVE